MALNKEYWSDVVSKQLLASSTFVDKIKKYNQYVTNKYVHIPVQQADFVTINVNPTSFPLTSTSTRVDADNQILMNLFMSNPIPLNNPIEFYEFSYDKAADVMGQAIDLLRVKMADYLLLDLGAWSGVTITKTSGTARTVASQYQSGTRNSLVAADIAALKYSFDATDVPDDRVLVLPPELYKDVVNLSDFKPNYLLTQGDTIDIPGKVGNLYGFAVVVRSRVLLTNSGATTVNTTINKFTDLATGSTQTGSNAAGLAFSISCVGAALGDIKTFSRIDDPFYGATVVSFSARAKAFNLFTTAKGLAVLSEQNVA